MAKHSMKIQGKEVGPASVYAGQMAEAFNKAKQVKTGAQVMNEMNPSVGGLSKGNYAPENPYGTGVMRGYGAATKGRKISGKMG